MNIHMVPMLHRSVQLKIQFQRHDGSLNTVGKLHVAIEAVGLLVACFRSRYDVTVTGNKTHPIGER
jgi:hypothetical protein